MKVGDQVQFRPADNAGMQFGWVAKVVSATEANLCVVKEDGTTQAVQGAVFVSDGVLGHDYFTPARKQQPLHASPVRDESPRFVQKTPPQKGHGRS